MESMDYIQLQTFFQLAYPGYTEFKNHVILKIFGDRYETVVPGDTKDRGRKMSSLLTESQMTEAEEIGIRNMVAHGYAKVSGGRIFFYDITVSDKVKLHRNRVAVQKLVHSCNLSQDNTSAFMLIHYENHPDWDWRFTFCAQGLENSKEFTDSKRYTYLLGPNQACKTAAQNFAALFGRADITQEDLIRAFEVATLNNEFFKEYEKKYNEFVSYMCNPSNGMYDDFIDSSLEQGTLSDEDYKDRREKPIRDYVKKLLGRLVFIQFLEKKGWMGVPADKNWGEGDYDFLRHLFKNASDSQKADFLDQILEPMFRDALNGSNRTNSFYNTKVEGFTDVRIPFLGGGLFEDSEHLDAKTSKFPASYFEDLFEFFYEYNFTIDENDESDAQVGVDPEMLGQIFEGLLEDNHKTGAYYTPKEIVQYMCKESLIAHLQKDLSNDADKEAIKLFVYAHTIESLPKHLIDPVDQQLRDIKICDPAIGSGAFPMGLLKELFSCRVVLEENVHPADIKKEIIQNNIYGVDIEKGAVDIARLRFWLSLIVDAEEPDVLPNMDFKIMQGNSLLEEYKGVPLNHIYSNSGQMEIAYDEVTAARMILKEKIYSYYHETDPKKKEEMLKIVDKNVKKLIVEETPGNTALHQDVEMLNLRDNHDFFLWHTWFADVFETGGFDLVIGNPPYIRRTQLPEQAKKAYEKIFASARGQYDMYLLFIEFGLKSLKSSGHLCFINPIRFFNADYGEGCRSFIIENAKINKILDISQMSVFANAMTYPCILLMEKNKSKKYDFEFSKINAGADNSAVTSSVFTSYPIECFRLTKDYKFIIPIHPEATDIIVKINKYSQPLEKLFDVARGLPNNKVDFDGVEHVAIKSKHVKRYELSGTIGVSTSYADTFADEMLILPRTVRTLKATLKPVGIVVLDRIYYLTPKLSTNLKFILGVLNSDLANYWFEYYYSSTKVAGGFFDLNGDQIKSIPIPKVSSVNQKAVADLVSSILDKRSKGESTIKEEQAVNKLICSFCNLNAYERKAVFADSIEAITEDYANPTSSRDILIDGVSLFDRIVNSDDIDERQTFIDLIPQIGFEVYRKGEGSILNQVIDEILSEED